MNEEIRNEIVEKNFFQKNWIIIALCILLIIGGVITFIFLKSPNENKENNNNNNNNTNNTTINNPLSTSGLTQAKVYKPCANCADPEYDQTVVTITNSSILNTLISKLNNANEYTPVGGMGLGNNPLKFELSYSNNVTTVLILEEDRIAIKVSNGSYKIYDLSSSSNIKTYVTDLYNQNKPITNPLSTSSLTKAEIYKPCADCADPEYDSTVATITSSSVLNTLISKLNNASEYVPVGGMGLGNNPLKFELSYSNSVTTVLILEENRVAIKVDNGTYKIYDLSSGTNIKTYVSGLYNTNK